MSGPPRIPPEALISHAGFVRSLAREFLGAGPDAEDVAQDALVAGLTRGPRAFGALTSWLRVVVRNLSLNRLRADGRRRSREERVTSPVPPTPDQVLAGEHARREVVQAVLALPEPYRGSILLRYYEERSLAELASAYGVPVETARTRLKRALALLRTELQERAGHGGLPLRQFLIPLAGSSLRPEGAAGLVTKTWIGVTVMNTKAALTLGAVGLLLLGGLAGSVFFSPGTEPSLPLHPRPESAEEPARSERTARLDPRLAPPRPAALGPAETEASSVPENRTGTDTPPGPGEASTLATVDGRVRYAGSPGQGTIRLETDAPARPYAAIVEDGTFRIPDVRTGAYRVSFTPDGGDRTLAGVLVVRKDPPTARFEVDLEDTVSVSGIVSDEATGRPFPQATVQVLRTGVTPGHVRQGESTSVKTDAIGEFHAAGLVRDRYRLVVIGTGRRNAESDLDLTSGDVDGLRITLSPIRTSLMVVVRTATGGHALGRGYVSFQKVGEMRTASASVILRGTDEPVSVPVPVEPGVYDLRFRMLDRSARFGAPVRVTLREGQNGPIELTIP